MFFCLCSSRAGIRQQNGEGDDGRRLLESDLIGQLGRPQKRGTEIRGEDEKAIRILGRLVPNNPRLVAAVLRVQPNPHQREFLPDGGRRVGVRRLSGSVVPSAEEADRDA